MRELNFKVIKSANSNLENHTEDYTGISYERRYVYKLKGSTSQPDILSTGSTEPKSQVQ